MTASRRAVLRGLGALPAVAVPAFAAGEAAHPDAALLELGRQWMVQAARYDAASQAIDAMPDFGQNPPPPDVDAALTACAVIDDRCGALQAEIARAQARTLDGIMVKARVVFWLNGHDLNFQIEWKVEKGDGGTEDTMLLTIARDLVAIGGVA